MSYSIIFDYRLGAKKPTKEFQISEFDKEMIKKGKLLGKSWNEEWQQYKNTEKSLQKEFSKEETNKAKDILGF